MKAHLIGINGVSMQAIAQYLHAIGHEVDGCDLSPQPLDGFQILSGHDPVHLNRGYDQVIYTAAVGPGSAGWSEVKAAQKEGMEVLSRAEVIGRITRERKTIAVTGMHGKSTTTGIIASILIAAHRDPLVMIGAPLKELGGFSGSWGQGQFFRWGLGPFVLEADEHARQFLAYTPHIAIITNIEPEHLDYYQGGLPEIIDTFVAFAHQVEPSGVIVANGDDANLAKVLTQVTDRRIIRYGRGAKNDYRIAHRLLGPTINAFDAHTRPALDPHRVTLALSGNHNQENALAALVVADLLGIGRTDSLAALAHFSGVGRRFDFLGTKNGALVFFDYGHHPTEIEATIAAARAKYPELQLSIVFQPHQVARTKLFLNDFARTLSLADEVVVTDIFGVAGREGGETVSAQTLAQLVKPRQAEKARYVPIGELKAAIEKKMADQRLILLMGAGADIRQIAAELTPMFK